MMRLQRFFLKMSFNAKSCIAKTPQILADPLRTHPYGDSKSSARTSNKLASTTVFALSELMLAKS
jgi:hypothetical protein